jgi:hypothetical protein
MIVKQAVPINFSMGLDTKTEPYQVEIGKFLSLQNSIFQKGGLLQKRNGYSALPALPNDESVYLTTLNGNLTTLGSSVMAYSSPNETWISKGTFQPLSISVLPVARSAINQTQCDSVVSPSGFVCTVYTEVNNGTSSYKYVVAEVATGQNIVPPTVIPVSSGAVTGSPRVFLLSGYFIIVFTNDISGTYHLQYIAVSISNPAIVTTNADLAAAYTPAASLSWDGCVVDNSLYFAYYTSSGGGSVDINYLTSNLTLSSPTPFSGSVATMMSVCADLTIPGNPVIYAAFYNSGTSTGYVVAVNTTLQKLMTATEIISATTVYNITSAAQNGAVTVLYEVANTYSYDSSLASNYVDTVSVTLPATVTTGTVGSATTVLRSVGLASKAFLMNGVVYVLVEYGSLLQSTYFLTDTSGHIISRFAYENGGASLVTSAGYLPVGLPQAEVSGTNVYIAYLYKDLIESQNTLGLPPSIGPVGTTNIYTQTGVNLITLGFDTDNLGASEIGGNLNISGGLLWAYDGQTLQEQNFNVFPDNVEVSGSATSGSMTAQQYYYQVIYQWTDATGNVIMSAPSIPVTVTLTSDTSVTVNIPTLRLSYKTGVKILIYRWSTANQIYYQVTSLTAPTLNNPAVDSIAYTDTQADSSIVGNSIIYTTGGVLEDVGGPAAVATTLFDDRLWLIDAEDQNLLWYSKQIIEGTPVEMSDLLTFYIAPSTGAQGSTGPITAIFPMDDKLIVFKRDAIYYINGSGPDNTGANSQYSQPIFITSTVGCSNERSIVITPTLNGSPGGLMFQSDKGIWLLGRDLSTTYIGAPVEAYNSFMVGSATAIPGTNQVRFTISNGMTLMYDYYYQQWGTFVGVPAISATLYQNLHTYLSASGGVAQETVGQYLDNGNPVLLSFTTSWIALAGLQGYQRAYFFYLLGTYFTPHKLNLQIAYDYNSSPIQNTLINPTNYGPAYGSTAMPVYGQLNPYGGGSSDSGASSNIEQWRVFLTKQRCTSFQITLQELYDPSFGEPAGQGLTLSGLNLVVAVKKGWRPTPASSSAGGGTNSP